MFKISQFKNKNTPAQFAVGVSFDFEKIVNLIHEKSRQNMYRTEIGICSIGENLASNSSSSLTLTPSNQPNSTKQAPLVRKKSNQKISGNQSSDNSVIQSNNLQIQYELKNRLLLYKQLATLNKNFNISTHLIHEKFLVVLNFSIWKNNFVI